MGGAARHRADLEREIERLQRRVAQLEERLEQRTDGTRELAPAERRLLQTDLLLELARSRTLHEATESEALHALTETAARGLDVERASIWLYDQGRTAVDCSDLFVASTGEHLHGSSLASAEYPAYFAALEEERAITADDARTDPRTREFSESYLKPLGITSMLDAPIRVEGRMIGVVCHEHVGEPRRWCASDQSFAASLADFVALTLSSTRRRALEATIAEAQRMESLALMAGGIAHDFNNMLVAVLGNAELALEDLSGDSPARPAIVHVRTAALRAADLARQLLACSGKGKLATERLDLAKLVREMSDLLESSISHAARLEFDCAPDTPTVVADPTQVRQVVLNLIVNASEALDDGDGVIRVSTRAVEADRATLTRAHHGDVIEPGLHASIQVTDTGVGMDPDTVSRMFDPFFSTKPTGRGLGLAAVGGIVRGHHGAIRVASAPDRGTTFEVLLPAATNGGETSTEREPRTSEAGRGGTVLLVDDDESVRATARRILEGAEFRVLEARDGASAVKVLSDRHDVSLVLLDMTMPGLSGERTFQELGRVAPDVPVVACSGYPQKESLARFNGGRAPSGFLQKPYSTGDLLATVREILS